MRRKEKQAQTRAALIEAARQVLAERGLAGISLDEIASRAGDEPPSVPTKNVFGRGLRGMGRLPGPPSG